MSMQQKHIYSTVSSGVKWLVMKKTGVRNWGSGDKGEQQREWIQVLYI
jgi:hypothetical protein